MNAYLVTSDFHLYDPDGPIAEIVIARSRGKARMEITWEFNLDYTERGVHINKIADNVQYEAGICDIDHPIWDDIGDIQVNGTVYSNNAYEFEEDEDETVQ